jgi:hypothetical protein
VTEARLIEAIRKNRRFEKYFARFLENVETPSVSKDGHILRVGGNIDQPGEVQFVKKIRRRVHRTFQNRAHVP